MADPTGKMFGFYGEMDEAAMKVIEVTYARAK